MPRGTTRRASAQHLPSSGDARWLGVRVNGGAEQPRVVDRNFEESESVR